VVEGVSAIEDGSMDEGVSMDKSLSVSLVNSG